MSGARGERIEKIDFIRGIAIILVICGHGIELLEKRGYFSRGDIQIFYDTIYSFHVPLFFMISGYVGFRKMYHEQSMLDTMIKYIFSLYIPFVILNFLYYFEKVMAYFLGIDMEGKVTLSINAIVELFYIPHGAAWFFLALFSNKVFFAILEKFLKEKIIFIAFIAIFWCSFLELVPVTLYLDYGMFYCVGYLMHKYHISSERDVYIKILSFNAIMVGVYLYINVGLNSVVRALVGISVFLLLILCLKDSMKIKVVNFCGSKCIVLCIVHQLSQYICFLLCSKIITVPVLLLIMMIILQMMIFYVVYYLYSRIKVLYWLEYIFYPYKIIKKNF